jgi:predicted GTPase
MIVLDEQLQGRNLQTLTAAWYPGTVLYITDLRPHTVIKDQAIPALLRQQSQPTFVTINVSDFWQQIAVDDRFCVICFTLPDARVREIASVLRTVLQHPLFSTKAKRMGKVIRITDAGVTFYTSGDPAVKSISD